MRARLLPTVMAAMTLVAGLGAREFLPPWPAKYVGVALYATLVYALVWWVRPALGVARAALIALAISWLIELAQLTPGPAWLASQHLLLRLIFGTTFSWWDMLAYPAGIVLGAAVHTLVRDESGHGAKPDSR